MNLLIDKILEQPYEIRALIAEFHEKDWREERKKKINKFKLIYISCPRFQLGVEEAMICLRFWKDATGEEIKIEDVTQYGRVLYTYNLPIIGRSRKLLEYDDPWKISEAWAISFRLNRRYHRYMINTDYYLLPEPARLSGAKRHLNDFLISVGL